MKMYSEMSEDEMLAWGSAEHDARIADLAGVKSQEALQAAQANAERRRKAIKASRSAASRMITDASRERRWTEARIAREAAG